MYYVIEVRLGIVELKMLKRIGIEMNKLVIMIDYL